MKGIVNLRPFVLFAAGLISGIIIAYAFIMHDVAAGILSATIGLAFGIVLSFCSTSAIGIKARIVFFALFLLFGCIGSLSLTLKAQKFVLAELDGQILKVTASVSEIKREDDSLLAVLDGVTFSGAMKGEVKEKIYLTVYGYKELSVGDRVEFTSSVSDRNLIYNGVFQAESLSSGIRYYSTVQSSDIKVILSAPNIFQRVRLFIYDTLNAGLSDGEFGVCYAMLTGNSDFIAAETLNAYRSAGVAHIFAVSGLHIGILAGVFLFILKKLNANKYVRYFLTVFVCLFYSGVCGFTASSLRATVMFAVSGLSVLLGRKYDGVSSLSFSAFLILLFDPAQLFCAGFRLSFVTVLSIIILNLPLSALFQRLFGRKKYPPFRRKLFGAFSVALSAFVNLLFIPLVGVVFIALIACVILGGIFSPAVFLFPVKHAVNALSFLFEKVNFGIFNAGGFVFGHFSVLYYLLLLILGGMFGIKPPVKTVICIALSVIIATGVTVCAVMDRTQIKAVVLGSDGICATMICKGEQGLLVVSDTANAFSNVRLNTLERQTGVKSVTVALLNDDSRRDIQELLTKFNYTFNVTAIVYYGEREYSAETVIGKQFPNTQVFHATDGGQGNFAGGKFEFSANGNCLIYRAYGKTVAVFSNLPDGADYKGLSGGFDLIVAGERVSGINREYSPKKAVSYRKLYGFSDGEINGNLTLYVNAL